MTGVMAPHDLLPCPFCGKPTSCARVKNDPWQGGCSNPACFVQPSITDIDRASLVRRWNTRAAETELREALKDCVKRLRRCAENAGNAPFAVDGLCEQFERVASNTGGRG